MMLGHQEPAQTEAMTKSGVPLEKSTRTHREIFLARYLTKKIILLSHFMIKKSLMNTCVLYCLVL